MTDIVRAGEYDGAEGLGDFDPNDQVLPRLKINHGEATFQDSLTNEEFGEIDCIVLGLVKQRVLWPPEMEEEAKQPLCRSYDAKVGRPPDPDEFPAKAAGFDRDDFASLTEGDQLQLSCEACNLKEWDSHPNRKVPWCSEQYVLPLLLLDENGGYAPMVLTLQRSAISPAKKYISRFATAKQGLFTVVTHIGLTANKRGTVNYAVPTFKKLSDTNADDWATYAEQYRGIRAFLTTPRAPRDDEDDVAAVAAEPEPAKKAAPAKAKPVIVEDDEEPF